MQSRRVRKTEHATKRQRHYDHYLHEKDTIELRQRDSHEQTKFPSLFFLFTSSARKPHIYCCNEPLSEHSALAFWE